MSVKDKEGRKRYIAFRITYKNPADEKRVDRNVLVRSIKGVAKKMDENFYDDVEPWLTKFDGRCGVMRCRHIRKEEAIMLLRDIRWLGSPENRIPVSIETLGTSGTILTCVRKFLRNSYSISKKYLNF
ncbi:MAG: hypothetical protein CVT48_05540 [Thermoplasmata archaeon HGW-Thermoplasmata-1]|nr:MAG: hypothetical protein CVT48_05540 [Thermoplasmata archaeon HGW-Thermoplasmata-1]